MLILIILLFLAIGILGLILYHKSQKENGRWSDRNDKWVGISVTGFIISGIFLVVLIAIGVDFSSSMVIDDKIAYLTKENLVIEKQIQEVVSNYQNYEQSTFEKFKSEPNVLIATSMFPELKSDNLVQQQIELYRANHKAIKELELKKMDYRIMAWWMFFRGE